MTFQAKLARFKGTVKIGAVAHRAGVSPQAMSNYIHRGNTPKYDVAVKIAQALGVEISWLLDDAKDWPPVWTDRNKVFETHDSTPPPDSDAA